MIRSIVFQKTTGDSFGPLGQRPIDAVLDAENHLLSQFRFSQPILT